MESGKFVNEYLQEYIKKHGNALNISLVTDILESVERYNYYLTWNQTDLLERTIGDLLILQHNDESHYNNYLIETTSLVTFVITCGEANLRFLKDTN